MDDSILLAKMSELHELWWEIVWDELAWDENGCEPADFALTIKTAWANFGRMAKDLEATGIDIQALVAEFEAKGDPKDAILGDYAAMLGRTRCVS
jgi:hypothetical protein